MGRRILVVLLVLAAVGVYRWFGSGTALTASHILEGLQLAASVRQAVDAYYWNSGELPESNAQVGLPSASLLYGAAVRSVEVSRGGVVTVEFNAKVKEGATLVLAPSPSGANDRLEWQCTTDSIPPGFLENIRPPCLYTRPSRVHALFDAIHKRERIAVDAALREGVDVNIVFRADTPLMAAIERGDLGIVRALVEAGADTNKAAPYYRGLTPLMLAARNGRGDIVELLLAHGADPKRRDAKGKMAVDHVARQAANGPVYDLLRRAERGLPDAAARSDSGGSQAAEVTALLRAALEGDRQRIEQLLGAGVPVDATDDDDATPLMYAIRGRQVEAAAALLARGAAADRSDRRGETPLMLAAEGGAVALVRLLLEQAVDPNAESGTRETALSKAARQGHVEVVEALLAAGAATPEQRNQALVDAVRHSAVVPSMRMVELLIGHGADANAMDRDGLPLLLAAIFTKDAALVGYLLAQGARPDEKGSRSHYPLYVAARDGLGDIAVLLLGAGATPDLADAEGRTPLMAAVDARQYELVRQLVARGADPQARDRSGLSAITIAKAKHYTDILDLLNSGIRRGSTPPQ